MMQETCDPNGHESFQPLITLKQVSKEFDGGRVVALRSVDLSIHHGDFTAIIGPSGCGKSTLLQILGSLDQPDSGTAMFGGLTSPRDADRVRFRSRCVGFVFQSFHLIPTLTALENVQVPMFELPWTGKERTERASSLLHEVGLGDRMGHIPSALSGGERQRVAIARSLANHPKVILADEPTGNLDSTNARKVLELLARLHRDHNTALVIATHDPSIAANANRIISMCDGSIVTAT